MEDFSGLKLIELNFEFVEHFKTLAHEVAQTILTHLKHLVDFLGVELVDPVVNRTAEDWFLCRGKDLESIYCIITVKLCYTLQLHPREVRHLSGVFPRQNN